MSGVSFPVTRQNGRCLIVGQPACRSTPLAAMQREGIACTEVDDPYDAMTQLCRRPLFHTALILSLHGLYREELQIIASVKRRFSHIEVWLCDTDGRQAALAEAMRLGADGLLAADGLHRIGTGIAPAETTQTRDSSQAITKNFANPPILRSPDTSEIVPTITTKPETPKPSIPNSSDRSSDPVLTAEELRALLADPDPIISIEKSAAEK